MFKRRKGMGEGLTEEEEKGGEKGLGGREQLAASHCRDLGL